MMVSQSRFISAVLDPDHPAPAGLTSRAQQPTGRFSIYRNNVIAGLTDALISAFPILEKLVGNEFFRAMAGVFIRKFPPDSPVLAHFGHHMPEFLEQFEPVAHLPYLPDMARLELSLRESYHEADSKPVENAAVLEIPAAELPAMRFELAPSVRILRSRFPVCSIWLANARDGANPGAGGEDILIARPEFDPEPAILPPGGLEFLLQLRSGADLGHAYSFAMGKCGAVRLDAILAQLVSLCAIVGVSDRK